MPLSGEWNPEGHTDAQLAEIASNIQSCCRAALKVAEDCLKLFAKASELDAEALVARVRTLAAPGRSEEAFKASVEEKLSEMKK